MIKDQLGVFPDKTNHQISLMRYTKTSCGVDFLLNTADNHEKASWFDLAPRYKTDFFEFYFFKKANGYMFLAGEKVELHDGMLLIISPYQQQEWHTDIEQLEYTFLVFQEEFVNNFLSDTYFMYRLLYCYQNDTPTYFDIDAAEAEYMLGLLKKMKVELREPVADSYQMILAYLYEFLLKVNRYYAKLFNLPFAPPQNNYAYRYKQLLEQNICKLNKVNDYADLMNLSRITLNKAVMEEFGVSASHLLKQRLLQEVKNALLFTDESVKEIAFRLNFSEPNHLMRFFKQQTGMTISNFVNEYNKR